MSQYAERPPAQELADVLSCVWTYRGSADEPIQHIVPDGCCELIVHIGRPYSEIAAGGRAQIQPQALFAGQLTLPLRLKAGPGAHVLGLRFRPESAMRYAGRGVSKYTNRRTDLAEICGRPPVRALLAAIRDAPSDEARSCVVEAHVSADIARRCVERDMVIEASVRRIVAGDRVAVACENSGLSARQFQRRFLDVVGLAPRTLRAVLRLQSLFHPHEATHAKTWTRAALAAGFYDQPQMTRDFRKYVGCSPMEFIANTGLAARLARVDGG